MGFLDMGMGEIVLILVVALILLGPDKVPEIARTLGKVMRNLRKATADFTTTLTREIDTEDKKKPSPSTKNTENGADEPDDGTAPDNQAADEAEKQQGAN